VQGVGMMARARIELAETDYGGLTMPMPPPCRSLILRVEHDVDHEEQVELGVQIFYAVERARWIRYG
jgi:hypothetical protein